jgi:hypothetical protein
MSGIWDTIKATAQSIRKTLSAAARGLTIRFTEDEPAEEPLRIRIPRSPPRKPPTHPGPPRGPTSGQTRRASSSAGSYRRRSATPENAAMLRRLQAEGVEPVTTEQPSARQMNRISIPIKQLFKLGHAGIRRRELDEVEGRIARYFEGSPLRRLLELDAGRDLHRDNWPLYQQSVQDKLVESSTEEFVQAGSLQMSSKAREVYAFIQNAIEGAITTFTEEPIERILRFNPNTLPAPVYQGMFDTTLEEILGRMNYAQLREYETLQNKMHPRVHEIYRRIMQAKRP